MSARPDGSTGWSTTRVAVIGDVGGHLGPLVDELVRLGADPSSGWLPPDLTVVQVGDLVHRGPDSDGVVALVDRYLTHQPGQWVQLVGNHEAQYLREPAFDWPERIGRTAADTLRRWWTTGTMRAAAAVRSPSGDHLVTHAGVTAGFWQEVLGGPDRAGDAPAAAAAVNGLIGIRDDDLFRAGSMLGGRPVSLSAGPLWASAATELVPSWLAVRLPFDQVHGHTSIYDWQHGRFRGSADVVRRTTIDGGAGHETTVLDGGVVIGVDPGHGHAAHRPWQAWEAPAGAAGAVVDRAEGRP